MIPTIQWARNPDVRVFGLKYDSFDGGHVLTLGLWFGWIEIIWGAR